MTRLPPLDPAVAETRVAVREFTATLATWFAKIGSRAPSAPEAPLLLVGLSGGADSLALAAAVAFEAPKTGLRAGAVIIDHGLQTGSAEIADRAADQARSLGLDPVVVRRVSVPKATEAAAREARYAAFEGVITDTGAATLLTAHTRDDQAEQVLLALARGSGTRAIAGIPPMRGAIIRPFLRVTRETTEQACRAQGLDPWRDPHNSDPVYARVRVRERVLPMLETELGPGIAANLVRSAELAREDADALDEIARLQLNQWLTVLAGGEGVQLPILQLAMQPAAVRNRMIREVARAHFASYLTQTHTLAIAALVTDWRGQGPIHAPKMTVTREGETLLFRSNA